MPQAAAVAVVVAAVADAEAAVVVPALTLMPAGTPSNYEPGASLIRLASPGYRAVFAVRDAARGTGLPVT